eukprot:scaffold10359_cov18-Tisochrysis_lutea.AAC.1
MSYLCKCKWDLQYQTPDKTGAYPIVLGVSLIISSIKHLGQPEIILFLINCRAITREARRSELSVKGSVEAEKAVAKAEMEEVSSVRSEIVGPAMFCFECSSPGACANSCVREVAVYYIRSDTLALFYVECSSPGACTRGCFRDIALIIGSFQQTMEHLLLRLLPGPQSWLHSHDCGSQVTHMNEVLNRCASAPATISLLRVLSRQAEIDQLRAKVTELEIHIASQANFNPALLQQQIEELQINVSISERQ